VALGQEVAPEAVDLPQLAAFACDAAYRAAREVGGDSY
jgi:hypothetical protein